MLSTPAARTLWEHLVQWQPATAADLAIHLRAMPDDWPLRVFDVGRPDAAIALPPGAEGEQYPDRTPEIAPYDDISSSEDCPACGEAGDNCRFHTGYAAGHREAIQPFHDALKARPDMTLREFAAWQADVSEAQDYGSEPPALPVAVPSAPDADLRDRIARAIFGAFSEVDVWDHVDDHSKAVVRAEADAVLAALPAEIEHLRGELAAHRQTLTEADQRKQEYKQACIRLRAELDRLHADRAAVLREAADIVGNDDDCDCGGCDSCVPNARAAELRRMADEAQQAGPCEQHPTAPTFNGQCGGCTQYPADTIKAQPAEPRDTCRPVEVDGETIRVHGSREMTEQERGYLADVVRAAKRKFEAEHTPEQT